MASMGNFEYSIYRNAFLIPFNVNLGKLVLAKEITTKCAVICYMRTNGVNFWQMI